MVQPQTKTLIQSSNNNRSQNTSIYDKPLSTIMMTDADTMAERDLGSTFLLPHSHLYKDRVNNNNFLLTTSFKYCLHYFHLIYY